MSKSSTSERGALVDLLSGGAWQVLAALFSFVFFPIQTRVLDPATLGAWNVLAVLNLLLGMCDLGLSTAVQRNAVTGDDKKTRDAIGLALVAVFCIAPVAGLIALFSVQNLPTEWKHLEAGVRQVAPVVLFAGLMLAYAMPFRAYLYAKGGTKNVAVAKVCASLAQICIVSAGFFITPSLMLLGVATLTASSVELGMLLVGTRRFDRELPFLPRLGMSKADKKTSLRDGLASFSISIFEVIAMRVDILVLAMVNTRPEVVALFNYTGRIVEQPYLLTKQVLPALTPRLGNPAERTGAVKLGTAVFSSLITTGMLALFLVGQPLIVFVFGAKLFAFDGSIESMGLILGLYVFAYIMLSTYEVSSPMLTLGARTAWSAALPILIGGAVKYAISFTAAQSLGLWAVAGGTGIGFTIASVLTWTAARQILKWTLLDIAKAFIIPVASASAALAVAFPLHTFAQSGWIASALSCVAVCAAGTGVMVLLVRRKLA